MRKIFLMSSWLSFVSFAQTGHLFNTSYQVVNNFIRLTMTTNIPNRTYTQAGITLPNGASFVNSSCSNQNGQTCIFSISNSNPVTLDFQAPTGYLTSTLCLNHPHQLNCETTEAFYPPNVVIMGTNKDMAGNTNGIVYTGMNNGNWTVNTNRAFSLSQFKASYCATDGAHCIGGGFVGNSNANFIPSVFTSTDFATTWTKADTNNTTTDNASGSVLTYPLQIWSMSCLDNGFCLAGGNANENDGPWGAQQYSYLWYSTNFGQSWSMGLQKPQNIYGQIFTYIISGESCYYSSIHDSKQCIYAANGNTSASAFFTQITNANQNTLEFSSYTTITATTGSSINSTGISCNQNETCILTGNTTPPSGLESAFIYRSTNVYYSPSASTNWASVTLPNLPSTTNNLTSVTCDESGLHCVAGGWYETVSNTYNGMVYYSDNSGSSWQGPVILTGPGASSDNNKIESVACYQSTCYAVGHGGNLTDTTSFPISYISHNYGQTWSAATILPLPSDTSTPLQTSVYTVSMFAPRITKVQ